MHQPVLLAETLEQLKVVTTGIYIDATFGRGGHSSALLANLGPCGQILAMDKDPEAADFFGQHFSKDKRLQFYQGCFSNIAKWAFECGVLGQVQGILMDLGMSSPQLDNPARGFSFLKDGPLDMRLNPLQGKTAAQWLATATLGEMVEVFKRYGEERFSKRIASFIVKAKQLTPILTTGQLADIIKKAHPKWPKHIHPATKIFQAIRIHINQELTVLHKGLSQSLLVLKPAGRLAVITFHSLEAKVVKHFMRNASNNAGDLGDLAMQRVLQPMPFIKPIGRFKPNTNELAGNPRARSSILRVMEKLV